MIFKNLVMKLLFQIYTNVIMHLIKTHSDYCPNSHSICTQIIDSCLQCFQNGNAYLVFET